MTFALATLLVVPAAVAQDAAQDSSSLLTAIRSAGKSPTALGGGAALFQVSTLDALSSGLYDGSITVGQLKAQGDFGLGTYEGLDGEMIVLGGVYYHMRSNGALSVAADTEVSPFAAVTRFKAGVTFTVTGATMAQLSTLIDSVLPSKNFFYAIRIHGAFTAMTTRAIPIQNLPYLPLAQVLPTQVSFVSTNIVGTAVDIRSPAFITGINQVGHHYHFVSDDLKSGGHSLSFTTGAVTVEIQTLRRYSLWLPDDEPFVTVTLPIPVP
ncbi:MAG TPA: acetolactate decarboxylase [Candidatus Acidoferrales bacterium]|nr:acetolactate decarboxylase [Candidatus Acidoferrales bacterium]